MNYTFMTHKQFIVARLLAAKHNHLWACEPRVAELAKKEDVLPSVELIEAIMAGKQAKFVNSSLQQEVGRGAQSPTVLHGQVMHTSYLGRISWQVSRDGVAEITISRPQVSSLFYFFIRRGEVRFGRATNPNLVCVRHVKAAMFAASALADKDEVDRAFAELLASAQPDVNFDNTEEE